MLDIANSGVDLTADQMLHETNRPFVATNIGTSGTVCQPTTVQCTTDSWAFGYAAAVVLTQTIVTLGGSVLKPFCFRSHASGANVVRRTSAHRPSVGVDAG